ncbi:hypothetical protein NX059_007593 [Plenodomus lindquistii]|nr:hypothetical protein NX059_007593 [Plenodomus lindquistii]
MTEDKGTMTILQSFRKLTVRSDDTPKPAPPVPAQGTTGFLHLPGEIRNQIYALAIYPSLSKVQITHTTKPAHLGSNVVSPPIFRASRQIRSEAISYLCANKAFQILRIRSANVFFEFIGPAIAEIKEIAVEQNANELLRTQASKDSVAGFFAFVEQASGLEVLEVSGLGRMPDMNEGGVHGEFLRSLEMVGERGVKVAHWFGRARK